MKPTNPQTAPQKIQKPTAPIIHKAPPPSVAITNETDPAKWADWR
jgi:hypothetical protein